MRIGAITHAGLMAQIRLSDNDVSIVAKLSQHEAESLVGGLLVALAQIAPLRWQRISDDVREVRR